MQWLTACMPWASKTQRDIARINRTMKVSARDTANRIDVGHIPGEWVTVPTRSQEKKYV